ncbi:expressed unknown protein [Seminavis robusta]|uniref:Uncharacterized protein n=1 Tax=Seminavis robusta TaxID=568900 RepID=A0A9N8HPT9_9STRA|nr:expressed unknown protein [Seminavis robusta]|eukprot:Sro1127_g244190.1 n/a (108) ;mRNA; r:19031-19354
MASSNETRFSGSRFPNKLGQKQISTNPRRKKNSGNRVLDGLTYKGGPSLYENDENKQRRNQSKGRRRRRPQEQQQQVEKSRDEQKEVAPSFHFDAQGRLKSISFRYV